MEGTHELINDGFAIVKISLHAITLQFVCNIISKVVSFLFNLLDNSLEREGEWESEVRSKEEHLI